MRPCQIEGCLKPARSLPKGLCEMHYYRIRRTGSSAPPIKTTGTCLADGCDAPASNGGRKLNLGSSGYCRKHYLRVQKRGDAAFEFKGANNTQWTGDNATNRCVHQRLHKARGKASSHSCVDCGGRAAHWSYDHTDPDERFDPEKGPYSIDINRYDPRCVRCHKRFDLDFLKAKRQESA